MLENNVPSLRYGLTSITTYYEFDNYGRKALEKRIRENGYSTAIAYIYDTLNRVARCRYYRIKNNGKRKLFNTVFFDSAGQIVREKAKHHEEHRYRYYYNKDRSQEYKVDYYKNGWGNPWKSITTCKVIKLYPE